MVNTGTDQSRNAFLCVWRWRRRANQTSQFSGQSRCIFHPLPQFGDTTEVTNKRHVHHEDTGWQWQHTPSVDRGKTCSISVTCCFLWVGRCPSAMTPHPKETSWACTRLVRPLPPSPASGSLVDFERSLEQQLRKELNVKARNVCTVWKTWLISHGITVISDMNYFKLHFQLHKCWVLSPFGILYSLNLFYKSWSVEADIHQQYHQEETSWGMNSEWELLPVKSWRVTVMTRQMGEACEQSCLGIHHCQPHASVF